MDTHCKFAWPAEAVELLRRLASKRTASQISEDLSIAFDTNIGRNAVIGKCGRMGIPLTAGGGSLAKRPYMPRKAKEGAPSISAVSDRPKVRGSESNLAAATKLKAIRKSAEQAAAPSPAIQTFNQIMNRPAGKQMTWTEHSEAPFACEWPYDDRGPDGFRMFCGEARSVGPWCAAHALRVVAPDKREALARKLSIPVETPIEERTAA